MFAFCSVAIGPFLAEIWQISYFTLNNQGQGHIENWPKSNQVIYSSGPSILAKMKEMWKVVQKLSCEQTLWQAAAAVVAYEPVQKNKVTLGIPGWLKLVQKHKVTPAIPGWLN